MEGRRRRAHHTTWGDPIHCFPERLAIAAIDSIPSLSFFGWEGKKTAAGSTQSQSRWPSHRVDCRDALPHATACSPFFLRQSEASEPPQTRPPFLSHDTCAGVTDTHTHTHRNSTSQCQRSIRDYSLALVRPAPVLVCPLFYVPFCRVHIRHMHRRRMHTHT
jgi:hypothetical protein